MANINGSDFLRARSVATSSMKSVPSSSASSQSAAKLESSARQRFMMAVVAPAAMAAFDIESPAARQSRKIFLDLNVRTKRDMGG